MPFDKLVTKSLQRYWRFSRGLTMGAQGVIVDGRERVLLVRHTYRPGWHFPGGGVERRETVHSALKRELNEEVGVLLDGAAQLFGLYANLRAFPGDHIALFIVRQWKQPEIPDPNYEIAEQRFFPVGELPQDIYAPAARRMDEIFNGHPQDERW